jgi:cell wall assembly regulator SMI1
VREDTWAALDSQFARHPFLRGGPVPQEEIDAASGTLDVRFPDDYREFVIRHGGAIVGPYPVFGLRPVEPMGNEWSVLEVNRRYRSERWPGVAGWLIVSVDHAGNPMGIGPDGRVWISDHDFGDVSPIADSFEHFLRKECLSMS